MADIMIELKYMDVPRLMDDMLARAADARKSTNLLSQVFPPRIAKALKEGRAVEPESYDCVTIFFSDIVGYTTLSGAISAGQVTDLLDRLYSAFDQLVLKHGLFKVETIGDAYICVGNLPVAGQDWPCADHAARVARFALDVVACAGAVSVLEGDESQGVVHIRVGISSGPVVAAVVGKSNPKFCLLGDTVNTSSRMESNSLPDQIHVSEATARLVMLQDGPLGRQLELRGKLQIKGKGEMETYWVRPHPLPTDATDIVRAHLFETPGGSGPASRGPLRHGIHKAASVQDLAAASPGRSQSSGSRSRRMSVGGMALHQHFKLPGQVASLHGDSTRINTSPRGKQSASRLPDIDADPELAEGSRRAARIPSGVRGVVTVTPVAE